MRQHAVGAAVVLSLSAGVLSAVVAAPSAGHIPLAEEASSVVAPAFAADSAPPAPPAQAPPAQAPPAQAPPAQAPPAEAPPAGAPPPQAPPAQQANGVVVRFAPDVAPDEAAELVARHGGELREPVAGTGFYEVSVPPGEEAALQEALAGSHQVAETEVNHLRRAFLVPNDQGYTEQSSYLQSINLPSAWDLSTGADNLVLAILDSGIQANHPDFTGRVVQGYDIVNDDMFPNDDFGHGTWVAGVAAARTDNVTGVAGVAWKGRIMPVKVIDHEGLASDAHIAAGIRWATIAGADVINLSLGGPGASSMLQQAIDYAVGRGVVIVAAAGNAGVTEPNWPAAARNVIAVGASDASGNRASFSNYGHWIDLVAPGVRIWTTDRTGYISVDGTSFSAPMVAGIALLMRSVDGSVTPAGVADRLRRSARDIGPTGFDPITGAGLVDAGAALRIGGFSSASGSRPAGYWMLGSDGTVYAFGGSPYQGEPLGDSVVGADIEPMPSGRGYWVLAKDGAVYSFGENRYYGRVSPGQLAQGEEVISLSSNAGGDGYWIFTSRGRVFNFGGAGFLGDISGIRLNQPVVDSIPAPNGQGYYMVAADGGVFAVGPGASYRGSVPEVLAGRLPNRPVRSLVPDPDGFGYWLVAEDGGVFGFDAPYRGSLPAVLNGRLPNAPVRGMVPYGDAYLMVATDGGIFNFATNLAFVGSLGADPPEGPVVAVAALPR